MNTKIRNYSIISTFSVVFLFLFIPNVLASNLVFQRNEIDFGYACSYYKLYYDGLDASTDLQTLKAVKVTEEIGSFKDLSVEWMVLKQEQVPRAIYGECIYEENKTIYYYTCRVGTTFDTINVWDWQKIWKTDISKEALKNTKTVSADTLLASSEISKKGYIDVRFCGYIERELTEHGYTIRVDHIPSFLGYDYKEYAWWDSSWEQKKGIEIQYVGATGTLNNYQMLLNVTFDSNMNADFSDIRFRNNADNAKIYYWIQNKTDSAYADVWIKIPAITNSANLTVDMYYGNSVATSDSDGNNTFIFFDDFTGGTLNATTWEESLAAEFTAAVSGGYYKITHTQSAGGDGYSLTSNVEFTRPQKVIFGVNTTVDWCSVSKSVANYFGFVNGTAAGYTELATIAPTAASACGVFAYDGSLGYSGQAYTEWDVGQAYQVRLNSTNVTAYNETDSWVDSFNTSTDIPTTLPVGVYGNEDEALDYGIWIDYFAVANWNDIEPFYSFGAEEEGGNFTTINQTYETSVIEGASSTFSIYMNNTNQNYTAVDGFLVYNGTNHSVTGTNTTGIWYFTTTIPIPMITEATSTSPTVTWLFNFTNSTQQQDEHSVIVTQTIYRMIVSADQATYPTHTLNFTIFDEQNRSINVNGTVEASFTIWTTNMSNNRTYSFQLMNNTNHTGYLFLSPSFAEYYAIGTLRYYNTSDYTYRYYNLYNYSLTNTSKDLNLYLLDVNNASRILYTVQGSGGAFLDNVIIKTQRYYVESNSYITVSAPKTDNSGETIQYLEAYDVYYRYILEKNGVVLDVIPVGVITSSEILLTVAPSQPIDYFTYFTNIAGNCVYTNNTNTLSCTVTDTTGAMTEGCLRVEKGGQLVNQIICDNCETGSAVTIGCDIGGTLTGNGTYFYYLTATGSWGTLTSVTLLTGILEELTIPIYGQEGVLMSFILVGTMIMFGIFNPIVAIILGLIGLILCSILGIISMGSGAIIGLVIVGFIIIYLIRR